MSDRVASSSGTGAAYHGKEKLEALAEKVWTHGDIDDLDARSILAYIDKLEAEVAWRREVAEERELRGRNASSLRELEARRG